MEEKCKFKIILHSSDFKDIQYIKIEDQIKKVEGDEINFEFNQDIFNQFETSLPTTVSILDSDNEELVNFTLNLLKKRNTYHLFSGGHMELYELLFYNEEKVEIIVDGQEIKDYDSFSKFKRFSFINISNYEIKVNGMVINLENYLPNKNYKRNSFQLSFYDINKKYIVSKRIMKIKKANFSIFYRKYINDLKKIF